MIYRTFLMAFVSSLLFLLSCDSMSADDYVFEGQKAMKRQEVELAKSYFDKAIKRNPKFSKAYSERGKAYFNLGDNDKAIADFSKSIELSSDNADAYYGRGRVYQFLDDMESACKDWKKAEEIGYPYIDETLKMCRGYL